MTTRYVFSENDVSRQREINSRVERITGSIPTAPNRHKESPVSESGSSEYNGYFKVIIDPDDDTKIKVVDGADPTNLMCGIAVLDTSYNVPVTSLTKEPGGIYLNAKYENNAYSLELSFTQGNASFFIASISGEGKITQRWQDNIIYFGSVYFV